MTLDIQFIGEAFQEIAKAIPLTLLMTIIPLVFGSIIALAVTLIRLYKVTILQQIADFYVSFFRGTPAIMHIMVIYFGFPVLINYLASKFEWDFTSSQVPVITFIYIALSFTAGAYLSEIIRAGIQSVPKGEIEAAYSIGMHTLQVIRRILLPQALVQSIPNITNIVIGFLHTTSIAFLVSQKELTGMANIVAAQNLKYVEAFIAAAIIYWVISLVIELVATVIEKRLRAHVKPTF